MRKKIRIAALIAALMTCTILPLSAATPSEFYANLLRRGVAAYDAGRYDEASRQLRIAAFGLVESVDSYQLAQIYLTLAWDKLGETDRVSEAAHRLVSAERVERRYSSLQLPAAVRTAFEQTASRVLSAAELAGIRGTAPLPPAAIQPSRVTTVTRPATTTTTTVTQPPVQQPPVQQPVVTQPPVTVERVEVEVAKPQPAATQPPAQTTNNTTTATPPRTTTTTVTQPPATSTTQPRNTTPAPTTTTPPRAATTTTTTPPRTTTQPPAQTAAPTPARVPATLTAAEIANRFAAGERALVTSNLAEARRRYREISESANVSHENAIRAAEGLYRARDFAGALAAFDRAGAFRRGEEPYRYYVAVALYETGQIARAKRELTAALPHIELTPDVQRYRAKIESAVAP